MSSAGNVSSRFIPSIPEDIIIQSDPIPVPRLRQSHSRLSATQKLRLAQLTQDPCFRYHIPAKVKLFKKAIEECIDASCFLDAQKIFFEMERDVFQKFTFDDFENSEHREEAFKTRNGLAEKIITTDADLFFNSLIEAKTSMDLQKNPLNALNLFYEYARSIIFDVRLVNIARAYETYIELTTRGLVAMGLPKHAKSQVEIWTRALEEIKVKFFSNSSLTPSFASCFSKV